jgi:hypothetical protein
MKSPREYDDSYPTCVETYSTLRAFSDHHRPEKIGTVLQLEPTAAFMKGEPFSAGKLQRKTNGWFFSTDKLSDSKDTRRHIDLILHALDGKAALVGQLRAEGCEFDITSYWVSTGQGGPWLMPYQMQILGVLEIPVWWDIYFSERKDT